MWGPASVTISTVPEDLYQSLPSTSMWGPASVTISTVPEYFYQLLLSDSMWGPASVTISTVPEDLLVTGDGRAVHAHSQVQLGQGQIDLGGPLFGADSL